MISYKQIHFCTIGNNRRRFKFSGLLGQCQFRSQIRGANDQLNYHAIPTLPERAKRARYKSCSITFRPAAAPQRGDAGALVYPGPLATRTDQSSDGKISV